MHPQATCQLASLLPPCSTGGNSTIRPMPLRLRLDESRLAQPSLLTNCSSFASLVLFVWGKVSRSDRGSSAGDVSSFYSILVSISFLLVSLLAPRHDGRMGEYISRGKMGRRSFVFLALFVVLRRSFFSFASRRFPRRNGFFFGSERLRFTSIDLGKAILFKIHF